MKISIGWREVFTKSNFTLTKHQGESHFATVLLSCPDFWPAAIILGIILTKLEVLLEFLLFSIFKQQRFLNSKQHNTVLALLKILFKIRKTYPILPLNLNFFMFFNYRIVWCTVKDEI